MNEKLAKQCASDLKRYGINSLKELSFFSRKEMFGYRYTSVLRKVKYYRSRNPILFLIYRINLYRLSIKFGYSIPYSVKIGEGLYLGHLGTIVINSAVEIGNNVNIAQGVTIGYVASGKHKGTPKIGNNVWIGANAVVVGGITIGDDVMIAPNTFVNFDVPSHSLVIFSKANIISRENATMGYIENKYEE